MPAHGPERAAHLLLRALAGLAVAAAPLALRAQFAPPKPDVQFELRADVLSGPPAAGQLGVGVNVPAGSDVRLGIDAAGGAAVRDGAAFASGRVDAAARYLLDPYGAFKWVPYVGGGLTAAWDRRGMRRADLLIMAGIEGPAKGGWRTAFEVGLGGGARLGVVLRRARSNGR